ncbi:hypothetical protein KGF57_004032 [Candida theae]|uniref:J domain-containing protein n=1 Tax=Candida theae TaxID=1198502 RepID=A0AAD5BBY3_9ASCO|nr:uncharacterized protein KGF57_004032 [Candida theae]KAI5953040.1 hypothetical protein KGF57_004032 [Candida theae]
MVKSVRLLIERDINVHQVLQVPKNATTEQIKQAYQKQALYYQPAMQAKLSSQARGRFNLVQMCYRILSNPSLLKEYKALVRDLKGKPAKILKKSVAIKNFQRKLREIELSEQAEAAKKLKMRLLGAQQRRSSTNIEQLQEEGIEKRRVFEKERIARERNANRSIYDLPLPEKLQLDTRRLYTGRLEYKSSYDMDMDESVIRKIMSTFGEVEQVELLEATTDDECVCALVEFGEMKVLDAAAEYNYSSLRRWEGTDVQQFASLLRSCKKSFGPTGADWTNNATVNAVLTQYLQPVPDRNEVAFETLSNSVKTPFSQSEAPPIRSRHLQLG